MNTKKYKTLTQETLAELFNQEDVDSVREIESKSGKIEQLIELVDKKTGYTFRSVYFIPFDDPHNWYIVVEDNQTTEKEETGDSDRITEIIEKKVESQFKKLDDRLNDRLKRRLDKVYELINKNKE